MPPLGVTELFGGGNGGLWENFHLFRIYDSSDGTDVDGVLQFSLSLTKPGIQSLDQAKRTQHELISWCMSIFMLLLTTSCTCSRAKTTCIFANFLTSRVPRYPPHITVCLHENVILGRMPHQLSCNRFLSMNVLVGMYVVDGMVGGARL